MRNEEALFDTLNLVGHVIGLPKLNEIVSVVYGKIDGAEKRGYELGFADANTEALEMSRQKQANEEIRQYYEGDSGDETTLTD